jgi:hypothetical protein
MAAAAGGVTPGSPEANTRFFDNSPAIEEEETGADDFEKF